MLCYCYYISTGLGRNNEDCSHHKAASRPTGVYTIYPYGISNGISAYCDMDTDEGGWTVSRFLALLAKGHVSFCHQVSSVVRPSYVVVCL